MSWYFINSSASAAWFAATSQTAQLEALRDEWTDQVSVRYYTSAGTHLATVTYEAWVLDTTTDPYSLRPGAWAAESHITGGTAAYCICAVPSGSDILRCDVSLAGAISDPGGRVRVDIGTTLRIEATASLPEALDLPQALRDDYERSSTDTSLSSVVGTGDSAVITIRPRVQGVGWLEPSVRIDGVRNTRPTFKFTNHSIAVGGYAAFTSRAWQSTRRPMFSYDRETWTYFDTQTLSGTNIEFRHDTAFTATTVYISRSRQTSVHQEGAWLAALSTLYPGVVNPTTAAAAYTPTASVSDYAGQSFIADEFSAQTDDYGRAVPVTPFFAAKITKTSLTRPGGGAKSLAIVASGVHAGEDCGSDTMHAFIRTLLDGSTNSDAILATFDVLLYPMMNAPGRAGGGWRGCWLTASNGESDLNRAYNLTPASLETVDKTKTVINTDRAGATPSWVIDFHASFLQENWGVFTNVAIQETFRSRLQTESGETIRDDGDITDASFSQYWQNNGADMSITHESNTDSPVASAAVDAHAVDIIAVLKSMLDDSLIG